MRSGVVPIDSASRALSIGEIKIEKSYRQYWDDVKDFEWQWDNKDNRIKYNEMRIKSVSYDKYARFAVAGLILHRLISFIDVIYLERQNQPISLGTQMNGDKDSIKLTLSLNF